MTNSTTEQERLHIYFRHCLFDLASHILEAKIFIKEILGCFKEDNISREFIAPLELNIDELGRIQREVTTAAVREDLDQPLFSAVYKQQHAAWGHVSDESLAYIEEAVEHEHIIQQANVTHSIDLLERLLQLKKTFLKSYLLSEALTQRFQVSIDYWALLFNDLDEATLDELYKTARSVNTLAEFELVLVDVETERREK